MPTAIAPAGISVRTTALAPMVAPSPMCTAPRIDTFAERRRIQWALEGFVTERDALANDGVVTDDGAAMDHDAGLVLDDDAAAKAGGIGKLYPIMIADVAEEGPVDH
jgi:hypothetical protein